MLVNQETLVEALDANVELASQRIKEGLGKDVIHLFMCDKYENVLKMRSVNGTVSLYTKYSQVPTSSFPLPTPNFDYKTEVVSALVCMDNPDVFVAAIHTAAQIEGMHSQVTTLVMDVPAENCCHSCMTEEGKLKRCTGCGVAKYCSKECQTAHWKEHKKVCTHKRV